MTTSSAVRRGATAPHLIIVTPESLPGRSGTALLVDDAARWFRAQGCDVTVVTTGPVPATSSQARVALHRAAAVVRLVQGVRRAGGAQAPPVLTASLDRPCVRAGVWCAGAMGGRRLETIPMASTWATVPVRTPQRGDLREGGPFELRYEGGFRPSEDVPLVVELADELRRRDLPVTISVVGTGPRRQAVEEMLQRRRPPNVRLRNHPPPSRRAPELAAADLHLFVRSPGAGALGRPVALLDAFASGQAVLLCGGPPDADVVGRGAVAWSPAGDPVAAADRVAALLAEPARRFHHVVAGRRVLEAHRREVVLRQLAAALTAGGTGIGAH